MAVVRVRPQSSAAPIADFIASTTTPAVGGSVNFTDASTNSPTTWTWTFNGGTPSTSNAQSPSNITYSTAGLYQVTLTVTKGGITDTKTRAQYIDVGGTPSKWIKQNTAFTTASRGITCISIVNPYIVWAGAVDGTSSTTYIQEFTRTINGGITWTPGTISFTGSTTYGIANLCAFNDTVCYAAMFPGAAANGGYVAKTINGGTTWSIANSPSYTTSWLDFVHFFDASNGVTVGDPSGTDYVIYTTSNGGTSWTQVAASTLPNCTSGETAITNLFDAVGNTIWFGTTKGRIYKSTDKGLTWTVTATTLGTSAVVTPVFKDANNGIVTGTGNASPYPYIGMKKTTNGGSAWTALTPTGFYLKNPNLDYVPGTTSMWVDGSSYPGTGSSYSNNDCTSFLDIDTASTIQYICVKFYDINTGWAGSFNAGVADGGIYKWDPSIIVGVNEQPETSQEQISIYPNPTNDFINIKFFGITSVKANISVYNLMGKKVIDREFNPLLNDNLKLDISDNVAGIYLITVNTEKSLITKRISLIR